jgi:hypothetical protein
MSSIKQYIYLICEGTSTNDIIKSINKCIPKKTTSIFNFFKSSDEIEYEEFPKLENIGVKEIYMCQDINKELVEEALLKKSNKLSIYTSLNYSNIESAFVLASSFMNSSTVEILPLPYMSNNTNIKNKKILDVFKKKFGNKYTPIREGNSTVIEKTEVEKYWNEKNLNNEFLNIKKFKTTFINWTNVPNKIQQSALNTYSLMNFKKNIEHIILKQYENYSNIDEDTEKLIFICSPELIIDILKLFKKIKYNKKIDIIERSSIWELTLDLNFECSSNGKIIKKTVNYDRFDKKYPTEYNHGKLKYNGTYSYTFNNNKFILFDAMDLIPLNYLINIVFNRLSEQKRDIIKKILKNINKNKSQNINTSNKVNNKKTVSYNKLIEQLSE